MIKKIAIRLLLSFVILALSKPIANAQELALSTNMMDYVNYGTMNIQASYGLARHWSINAGVKYNPFTYNSGTDPVQNKQLSYAAGVRYWPWHIYSGWWLSGVVRYQEYNVGGIASPQTSEGDRFGGGISAGYTYMLGSHFNLDLGVGFWAGYDLFTTYACQTCGRIIATGGRYFFKPSDIVVALTYIF